MRRFDRKDNILCGSAAITNPNKSMKWNWQFLSKIFALNDLEQILSFFFCQFFYKVGT